jgi:hypothetical protein
MSTIKKSVRYGLNCAVAIAVSTALVAVAAAPAAKPTPNTHTVTVGGQTKTYANLPGAPVGGDASAAYQFRTSILTGKPGCQRFATDADNAFIDDKSDDATKVALLRKIGADASAAGCLAP